MNLKIFYFLILIVLFFNFCYSDEVIIPREKFDYSTVPPLFSDMIKDKQDKKSKQDRKMVENVVEKVISGSDEDLEKQAKYLASDKKKFETFLSGLPSVLAVEKNRNYSEVESEVRRQLDLQYEDKFLTEAKISLSLKNVTINDAIELVSKMAKLSFVIDPDVEGVVKFFNFKNVPVGLVLKFLLFSNKPELSLVKEFGVYRIMTFNSALAIAKRKIILQRDSFESVFEVLNNVKFDDSTKNSIEKIWKNILGNEAGKSGYYIMCDDVSKQVFFRGKKSHIAEMKDFLKNLDIYLPRIKVDVRIVIAKKDFEESFGSRWSGIYNRRASIRRGWDFVGGGNPLVDIKNNPSEQTSMGIMDWALNFFPSAGDFSRIIKLPFVFGGRDLNTKRLNLELDAAENRGDLKTILKPSILTNHNEDAEILVGSSIPIETVVKDTVADSLRDITTVTYKDVGTKLKVKPFVLPDKKSIFLDIYVENSSAIHQANSKYPTILTTRSSNRVALKSGQSTLIGGLIEETKDKYSSGVPILRKVPLIGLFFSGSRNVIKDHQLLIFITPTVI